MTRVPASLAQPRLLWLVAAVVAAAALFSSPGFFIIDEMIYYHGARAVAEAGSFVVDNGYETFRSASLGVWLLVAGPHGLVPQYPAGNALLGAPLVALLGPRGLILLNAAAAVVAVFLCRRLARCLYGDEALALRAALIFAVCTFLAEYALGIWPQALGLCFVLAALLWGVRAVLDPAEGSLRLALLAGGAVGIGMLFRLDTLLIVPPLALWAVVVAARPAPLLAAAGLGMLPGLAVGTLLNWIKFGVASPVTYGLSSGGVDPAGHLGALGLCLIAGLAALGVRAAGAQPRGRLLVLGTAAAFLIAAASLPAAQPHLARAAHGLVALIVDATVIQADHRGIVAAADGTVSFSGLTKKALGQSLPWIGALTFLLAVRWRPEERSRHVLCLLVIVLWALPFVMRAWYGGLASNMRYLLPILPVLAILLSVVWRDLASREGAAGARDGFIGVGLALAGLVTVTALHPGGLAAVQQIAATWLLGAIAVLGLLAAAPGRLLVLRVRAARVAIAMGLTAGFVFGALLDPMMSQVRRTQFDHLNAAYAAIPERSLVYGGPAAAYAFQLSRPEGLLALEARDSGGIDTALLNAALERGYSVYASGPVHLRRVLDADPALSVVGSLAAGDLHTLYQIGRAPAP